MHHTPSATDSDRSAENLIENYPGGALVVDSRGDVVVANRRGETLAALFRRGVLPDIGELIDRSSATGMVVAGTVFLPGVPGNAVVEATVVPHADGQRVVLTRDVTMERNLRSALVESRLRYKDFVEISSDFSWEIGADGTFVFVTPRGALGYRADELVGSRPEQLVENPGEFDPLPFLTDRRLEDAEIWLARADGGNACVQVSCIPLVDEDGIWRGARGICRDITDVRAREVALNRARYREQVLNMIARTIRDELDPKNMLPTAAAATVRALAVSGCGVFRRTDGGNLALAASAGVDLSEALLLEQIGKAAEGGLEFEESLDGWSLLGAPTYYRQEVNGVLCVWRVDEDSGWDEDDRILICEVANQLGIANEQIANHERIVRLSRTDDLTGLLNRRAFFEEELPRRFKRLSYGKETAVLMFLDMDNFKLVNDVHGHQKGDEAICQLRDILRENSRPGDLISRLGGDEFAVWMDGISQDVAIRRAEAILTACEALKPLSGSSDQPLNVSIGLAMFDPSSEECIDHLLSRADWAMYQVKRSGKGGFKIAAPSGQHPIAEPG